MFNKLVPLELTKFDFCLEKKLLRKAWLLVTHALFFFSKKKKSVKFKIVQDHLRVDFIFKNGLKYAGIYHLCHSKKVLNNFVS